MLQPIKQDSIGITHGQLMSYRWKPLLYINRSILNCRHLLLLVFLLRCCCYSSSVSSYSFCIFVFATSFFLVFSYSSAFSSSFGFFILLFSSSFFLFVLFFLFSFFFGCPVPDVHVYLFIYLLNIFKQGRTFRQKHCFTMLPCKEHLKIRQ